MKKIPFKNYLFLVLIVAATVFITFVGANLYKESKRVESEFYKYANTISSKEFDAYVTEYPNSIIYIYDKYSHAYDGFEADLKSVIEENYLKNNVVYIDKRELNKRFIAELKEDYSTEIKYDNKPIIIIVSDKEIVSVINIDENSEADSINLGVFE